MLQGLDVLEEKVRLAIAAGDPTAYLLAEHQWLRDLLDAYRSQARAGDQLAEVLAAMREMKPLLEMHIRYEEEAYFPALEDFMQEAGQGSMFDLYGEHDVIKLRLEQLLDALATGSGSGSAYGAFSHSLIVHFENEEDLIFAEAPGHLSADAGREILQAFAALKDQSSGA